MRANRLTRRLVALTIGLALGLVGAVPVEATPSEYVALDLGALDGGTFSRAIAVSPLGQVVGVSFNAEDETAIHGFSWTAAGGMVDLGTIGGTSVFPTA